MDEQYREGEVTQTPEDTRLPEVSAVEEDEPKAPVSESAPTEPFPVNEEPVAPPEEPTVPTTEPPFVPVQPPFVPTATTPASMPPMQKIEFTPVTPVREQKKASKGLKVFAVLLAFAIFISAASAAGYYFGRYQTGNHSGKSVNVDLAAKPKNSDEMTAGEVYEKVKQSVVGVLAYDDNGSSVLVSGIVFNAKGYIVTNDHIYEKISDPYFLIYTADGKEYEAEFVGGDSVSDLTVLKAKEGSFKPATFGNPDELYCGENVVAMENIGESGNHVTVTRGTVISTGLRVRRESSSYSQRLIVTDNVMLNEGTGAALVNMYGQVIGLSSYTDGKGSSYSVPADLLKRYVEDITANGRVTTRAKLGITYQYINSVKKEAKDYQATGALIETVASDSDLTGKVAKGDIVIALNGVKIESEDQMLNLVEACAAKDKASITVVDKSGNEKSVEFVLGANVGESAYQKEIEQEDSNPFSQSPDDNGGTFNFPRGE